MAASREMRAFRQFAELHGANFSDVEERSPPEPDILAVVDDARLAFELTEAVEPAYARKLSDMHKTPKLVRDGYDALSDEKRHQIETAHSGKMIDPCFHTAVSLRDRAKALNEIFEYIADIPAEFGSHGLERVENPLEPIDHIALSQVGWDGVSWQPGAPAGWIDPEAALKDRLVDKMTNKVYETEHPIELIVYLDRQIPPPDNTGWEEWLAEIAAQKIAESPFRVAWLMNTWSKSVAKLAV